MADYVVHVHTPLDQATAFAYMADLTNIAEWDPGVVEAKRVPAGPFEAGIGATYNLTVKAPIRDLAMTYEVITYHQDRLVVAKADGRWLTSLDRIAVEPAGPATDGGSANEGGSIVTYDARLTLNGPLSVVQPFMDAIFKRIGDRAAKGLIEALDGRRVESDATIQALTDRA
jgi:Polyketide cyclase / dehydrase and lipid transport